MEYENSENAFIHLPPSICKKKVSKDSVIKEKLTGKLISNLKDVFKESVDLKISTMKSQIERIFFKEEQIENLSILIISMEMSTADDWIEIENFLKNDQIWKKNLTELPSDYNEICRFLSYEEFSKKKPNSQIIYIPKRTVNLGREYLENLANILMEILAGTTIQVKLILPLINPPPKDLYLGAGLELTNLSFIDSRNLCNKFLSEITKSVKCLPFMSRSLMLKLATEVEVYKISLSELHNRIKKLLLSYVWNLNIKDCNWMLYYLQRHEQPIESISKSRNRKLEIEECEEELKFNKVNEYKTLIFACIDTFEQIFMRITEKDYNQNFQNLFNIITSDSVQFTLPDRLKIEISDLTKAKEECQKIKEIFDNHSNCNLHQYCSTMIGHIISESGHNNSSKNNKKNSAILQLEKAQENSSIKPFNELEKIIKHFASKGIIDTFNNIADELPELYLENFDQYHSLIKPDIVGNIFVHLYDLGRESLSSKTKFGNQDDNFRIKATNVILHLIGESGHEINGASLYKKFKDMHPDEDIELLNLLFLNALNELRYVGFLTETKYEKFTMVKTIFGKTRIYNKNN